MGWWRIPSKQRTTLTRISETEEREKKVEVARDQDHLG